MAKSTTCKDALKKWEEENNTPIGKAKEIILSFRNPPMIKMDNALAAATNCEKLSLSSNQIDKIAGVSSLKNLKILCLARNQIRSLSGIEALGDTLEELWISYNLIASLKGIQVMKNMSVFYVSHNLIKDWDEVARLQDCSCLQELVFLGNPLVDNMEETQAHAEILRRVPKLKLLDGTPVIEGKG